MTKNQLGFLYFFLSCCAFSIMDVGVKWLSHIPLGEVMFARGVGGIIPLLFLVPRGRLKNFYYTKKPMTHLLRCLAGIGALIAIFISLRVLPLATVTSLTYAAPMFTTILSIFLLGERVRLVRWSACIVGFLGVLLICFNGGNFDEINFYMFLPLVFCLGMSYVAILIKKLSETEPVFLISGYFSLTIAIVALFIPGEDWIMPNIIDFVLLLSVGISGGLANILLTAGLKRSEVSSVISLKYTTLVFAIFFGWLIWDEIPTLVTLSGAVLIIFSSLIIYQREAFYKKRVSIPRHE